MFLPNSSARYGLEDIRGSDPMSFAAYTELLRPIVIDDPAIDVDRVVKAEDPLLSSLNVRFLMAEPGPSFGPPWTLIYSGADGTLFQNREARGRFYVAEGDGEVRVRATSPTRFVVDVDARTPVVIASSQPGPGWRVSSGVSRLPGFFVGFRVPAGHSTVEVAYRPLSFYGSLPICLAAALLLAFRKSWNSPRQGAVVRGPDAESVP
jgi:hypothetical protein